MDFIQLHYLLFLGNELAFFVAPCHDKSVFLLMYRDFAVMSQRKRTRADEVKEEQIKLVEELLDEREQAIAHHRTHFSQRQIANIVS